MEIITQILKAMMIGWIVTRFQPMIVVVEVLYEPVRNNVVANALMVAFTCSKCVAFWASLLMFHNIWIAISASFLMVIYERTLGAWEKRIEF